MSFHLSSINPNDGVGGGGCLCHPIKSSDTAGPFIVFPATETDSNLSPHAVLCAGCVDGCAALIAGGESLAPGQGDVLDSTAVEVEVEELEL